MRLGLAILLALGLGAFAAHFALADRGYVLISFRGYAIEMSVPGLVLVLVALYGAVRGVAALVRAPRALARARRERRARRGEVDLARGLMHLVEGDAARAERLLTRGLAGTEAAFVNYLLAARAAQREGARARRDEWLKLAYDGFADGQPSVLLTQAELELEAGELDAALGTLARLERVKPDHPAALGLSARVHEARHDWAALAALLPRLKRARLEREQREAIALATLRGAAAADALDEARLAEIWSALPNDVRTPALIAVRAAALEKLGRGEDAERELRTALARNWDRALVVAYGEVHGADPDKQLAQAEAWLQKHPEDAALLLTAARLCIARSLWGKARSYLESSLALEPTPEAYALYGKLLGELGEDERAGLAFRSGLALTSARAAETLEARTPLLAPPVRDAEPAR